MGLLYAIASFLSRQQLEITLAKISTEAHCAIDSFYLTRSGAQVTEPAEIEAMTEGLRSALSSFFDSARAHA
jgi:[protein-PII] uridylyltransferase